MNLVFAFRHHTGIRLAEVGFLVMLFAGVWLVAAQIPQLCRNGDRMDLAQTVDAVIETVAA